MAASPAPPSTACSPVVDIPCLRFFETSHQLIGYVTTKPANNAMLITNQNVAVSGPRSPPIAVQSSHAARTIPAITKFIDRNSGMSERLRACQ